MTLLCTNCGKMYEGKSDNKSERLCPSCKEIKRSIEEYEKRNRPVEKPIIHR